MTILSTVFPHPTHEMFLFKGERISQSEKSHEDNKVNTEESIKEQDDTNLEMANEEKSAISLKIKVFF